MVQTKEFLYVIDGQRFKRFDAGVEEDIFEKHTYIPESIIPSVIFLDDVTFYHATSIFTFPRIKDKDYVLAVCSFNKYNNNVEENYYPSFNTSIEIQTTEYDYTIMYAIDKNNYRRSGFIIACRESNYITIYNKDLNVFNDNRLYIKGRG